MLRQPADPVATTTTLLYGPSPQGSPFPPESQQRLDQLVFLWLVMVVVAFVVAAIVVTRRARGAGSTAVGPPPPPS